MAEYIEIEGMDRVEKWLEDYPKATKSLIRRAMRRAAKPELARSNAALQARIHAGESKLKFYSRKDNIMLSLGFFGTGEDHNKIGKDVSDKWAWYRAYWINYGTLEGRDPKHKFKKAIKENTNKNNSFGIMHENFFEYAMIGAEERIANDMMDTVLKSIDVEEKKINNGK